MHDLIGSCILRYGTYPPASGFDSNRICGACRREWWCWGVNSCLTKDCQQLRPHYSEIFKCSQNVIVGYKFSKKSKSWSEIQYQAICWWCSANSLNVTCRSIISRFLFSFHMSLHNTHIAAKFLAQNIGRFRTSYHAKRYERDDSCQKVEWRNCWTNGRVTFRDRVNLT